MPSPLDDPLISTFGRLLEVYSRLEHDLGRDLETRTGLPLTWFEVLLRLSRSPGGQLTMGALSSQLALTSGGMTRLVDRVSAAGYVERRPCPSDRRVQFAAITGAGRHMLQEAAEVHAASLRRAFAPLQAHELASLDALLDRIRPQPQP
jgi:MarR family 2-MHQ and catechol resistance regulon transcriptional repressor